jgi:hypothetical protein
VTTYPKAPAQKPAAVIADAGRQVTRAHARLDQVESTQSKQTSDISTNATNTATAQTTATTAQTTANTATTTLTALDARLGGSSQETFLGSLSQIANFGLNATGGWTTGGALQAGTWDSTHATALVGYMNAVYADLQDLLQAFRNAGII